MITRYLQQALKRAHYQVLEDGTFCATVPGLRGVLALGGTLEDCRNELTDVIEEWILVRVARGLSIPRLGGASIKVKKAS